MRATSWIVGTALAMASAVSSLEVLVPLYAYPSDNSTWAPVRNAIVAHPEVNFTVIINPDSGTTDEVLSDSNYVNNVARVKQRKNVKAIGYVHVEYGDASPNTIESNITSYASWSSYTQRNISLSGIFFDEAPNDNNQTNIEYMSSLASFAKSKGLSIIYNNPGTQVESSSYFQSATTIVQAEWYYTEWNSKSVDELKTWFAKNGVISKSAAIVQNAPPNEDTYESIVKTATDVGLGAVYITSDYDYQVLSHVSLVAEAVVRS